MLLLLIQLTTQQIDATSIGIYDNFFALGGDSLISLKLVSQSARAGISFNVRQLFEHPTVAALGSSATVTNQELVAAAATSTATAVLSDSNQEEEEMLFDVVSGTKEEQHEPFALLGMQQAYWIGQLYITSLLQQRAYQQRQSTDSINADEPLPYYSPHVYLEYDVTSTTDTDAKVTDNEVFDYDQLERIVNTLIDRHGMFRAVMTHDGYARVLPQVPVWKCPKIAELDSQQLRST